MSPDRETEETWDVVDQRQTAATLRSAVHCLPGEQRKVIELAYYRDRSHSEIAEGLNIPLGTVKSRIRLGMAHLPATLGLQIGAL
jgi:RNA polymerase sigma factor (sigma-70 family)